MKKTSYPGIYMLKAFSNNTSILIKFFLLKDEITNSKTPLPAIPTGGYF